MVTTLPNNFFYVYTLVSGVDPRRHYTGITTDLRRRLLEHNNGNCIYTIHCRPWHIEVAVAFCSEAKARAFEQYLKSGSGRAFARRHF